MSPHRRAGAPGSSQGSRFKLGVIRCEAMTLSELAKGGSRKQRQGLDYRGEIIPQQTGPKRDRQGTGKPREYNIPGPAVPSQIKMRTGECLLNWSTRTARESLTRASQEECKAWNPAEVSSGLEKRVKKWRGALLLGIISVCRKHRIN